MRKPLIIIAGPTASGKTSVSVKLAQAINGEIISADSMQVYRGMTIGTAKVLPEEMDGVRHHLIDVLEPDDGCSIARFQSMVKEALEDIYRRGKVPILAGGTGFYIQAIVNDVDFREDEGDRHYREQLEKRAQADGGEALYQVLLQVDPEAARTIHRNNVKRVIRALEYHYISGERISDHNARQQKKTSPYKAGFYVLSMDREILYDRINSRVDLMIEQGLIDEVETLLNKGYDPSLVSMQGLGYKEIVRYLTGQWSLDEAVEILKRDTRRFAKRQLTWFRRESDAKWVDVTALGYNVASIVDFIVKDIEECKIL